MKKSMVILMMLVCSSLWLNSITWHIKLDGTGDFTTIQEGIDTSSNADTVLVYPGTYFENINYNGKNITVASLELITGNPQYISQTVIDGQRLTSCVKIVNCETNAHLRGLTITNGQGENNYQFGGGGVSVYCEPEFQVICTIKNCILTNNFSVGAAGLLIINSVVTLSGSSIYGNIADIAGGGIGVVDNSQIIFDLNNRCNIYNNLASYMSDIYISSVQFSEFSIIVDTFTVMEPTKYFISNISNSLMEFDFDILECFIEPIENDLYVSPNGNDNNTGLTEDNPLKTINLAVRNIASNPEVPHTIYLASGVYTSNLNDKILPFGCKSYVNIIGENMNSTIIDGEMNPIPFFFAFTGYNNSIIKNITFQNSLNYSSSPIVISRCDSIKFENIILQNNIISGSGAGITSATAGGNIQLENVTIDNISVLDGPTAGAWFNGTTSFKATDCTFSNNSCTASTGFSAGLYVMSSGNINIENCKFINNSTTSTTWTGYASAFLCTDYNSEMGNTYINNCLFSGNSNDGGKSTIYAQSLVDGVVHFTNNTIVDNQNQYGIEFQGNIEFTNNILRNDTYDEILLNIIDPGVYSTIDISYSNIDGGMNAIHNAYGLNTINWLEGNIDEDPLFLLSGDDSYQLTELSPCIDSGTPDTTGLFLSPWDLFYNHRVWDGDGNGNAIIDMGCYEFGAEPYVEIEDYEIPNTSPVNTNLSNYPNPFNPETTISFSLTEFGKIELSIYNIKGQRVKTLLECTTAPGTYECNWNGKDEMGKSVSSGQYIVKLKQNGNETASKIMLLK